LVRRARERAEVGLQAVGVEVGAHSQHVDPGLAQRLAINRVAQEGRGVIMPGPLVFDGANQKAAAIKYREVESVAVNRGKGLARQIGGRP